MEIEVRELGLAAYIRIKGTKMQRYDNMSNSFVFNSNKTLDEWRIEYLQSECYQHDKEVMSLRQFKK